MPAIAYYRVSTSDQSIEAQRHALLPSAGVEGFIEEFSDLAVSGSVLARNRPGFANLMSFVRKDDVICVYAVDRLGRDALDVQHTVRELLNRGVAIEVRGLGRIARGVGEIILAVLAQVARWSACGSWSEQPLGALPHANHSHAQAVLTMEKRRWGGPLDGPQREGSCPRT